MSEESIHFLGEEDFLPAMDKENRTWREKYVTNAAFVTRDGIRINYYLAENPEQKAVIVIVHGYCEFWGKYHEYAWYLWQAGYSVFFPEQRGHGYSGGKLPEPDVIHIDTFRTYAEDLHEFMEQAVLPFAGGLPLLMLGHSMGGAVGALFLELWPEYFSGAVLTSPMLKLQTGKIPAAGMAAIRLFILLAHRQKKLFPGQHHFDPGQKHRSGSTLSAPRYEYLFGQRLADVHYRTSGATCGWVIAGVDAGKEILKHADRIRIPVSLMQAGQDRLVDAGGFDDFMAKVPQARKFYYEKAGHAIFNAEEDVRRQYYSDILEQFAEMLRNTAAKKAHEPD